MQKEWRSDKLTGIVGLSTDVLMHASASLSMGIVVARPYLGAKIANSRGVPGTLGCIARTLHDGRTVLLSSWHNLFGNGGQADGAIWLVDETSDTRCYSGIGKTLYGKLGTVLFDGEEYYVDCAVGSCLYPTQLLYAWPLHGSSKKWLFINGHDVAQPGDLVTKAGAATGITAGIVVDVNYSDCAWIKGRTYPAPRQLLVRPVDSESAFSTEGDSGAVIVNAIGKAVGLLWGTNSRGEGVACPIGPVLHAMNITGLAANP